MHLIPFFSVSPFLEGRESRDYAHCRQCIAVTLPVPMYLIFFCPSYFLSLPQARIADVAKLEGKLDTENAARKAEIEALDKWAKDENEARKTEIANLDNFAKSENDAREGRKIKAGLPD